MSQKDEKWTIHFLNRSLLIRARWVVPVLSPPLSDAGILVKNGVIEEIGPFKTLKKQSTYPVEDLEEAVLLPALINPHLHLELSPLRGKLPRQKGFVSWVKEILKLRPALKKEEMFASARTEAEILKTKGVFALGDISNTSITEKIFRELGFKGYLFKEIIDLKGKGLDPEIYSGKEPEFVLPSAHATYTVSPELIREIKRLCSFKKGVFTIHCAESEEEVEFLRSGSGGLAELLKERGRLPENFIPPGKYPVEYLYELGVLDEKTLLVHCVHIKDKEIELIKKSRAWVCLCPRSNFYIGVGKAPAEKLFKAGIKLCLGTDSLASNQDLFPLSEIAYFLEENPWCPPLKALSFVTFNPARALGLRDLGAISSGFKACFTALFPESPFYTLFDQELKSGYYKNHA